MNDIEYAKFMIEDSATHLLHAAAVYAAPLILYWTLIG